MANSMDYGLLLQELQRTIEELQRVVTNIDDRLLDGYLDNDDENALSPALVGNRVQELMIAHSSLSDALYRAQGHWEMVVKIIAQGEGRDQRRSVYDSALLHWRTQGGDRAQAQARDLLHRLEVNLRLWQVHLPPSRQQDVRQAEAHMIEVMDELGGGQQRRTGRLLRTKVLEKKSWEKPAHMQALTVQSTGRERSPSVDSNRYRSRSPTPVRSADPGQRKLHCVFCRRTDHISADCYLVITPETRNRVVIAEKLCRSCFAKGHKTAACDRPPCTICGRDHHETLCFVQNRSERSRSPWSGRTRYPTPRPNRLASTSPGRRRPQSRSPSANRRYPSKELPQPTFDSEIASKPSALDSFAADLFDTPYNSAVNSSTSFPSDPRLMVVTSISTNMNTRKDEVLVMLLDSGAQHSFIKEDTAKRLGLRFSDPRPFTTRSFGGHVSTEMSFSVIAVLRDQTNKNIRLRLRTRKITTTVQHYRMIPSVNAITSLVNVVSCTDSRAPDSDLRKLWDLESLGIHDDPSTEHDDEVNRQVVKRFYDTVQVIDGVIYVQFPWKQDHPPLGDNRSLAFRRLEQQYEVLHTRQEFWNEYSTTKRTVLRAIASNFDPLGYLTPLFIPLKVFLQDLWRAKYEWDQPLSDQDVARWNELVNGIEGYRCSVPRFITYTDEHSERELLVFADASKKAFSAVAYLLSRSGYQVRSHLLMAKARVAPLDEVTIPRLELMACHSAVLLAQFLYKELKVSVNAIRIFSAPLDCIHRPLETFVANRVQKIRTIMDTFKDANIYKETTVTSISQHQSILPFTRTSRYDTLVRITAYVLRFIRHTIYDKLSSEQQKRLDEYLPLSSRTKRQQDQAAELVLLREHQREAVTSSRQDTYRDSFGIIRVNNRMRQEVTSSSQEHPILLKSNDPFTSYSLGISSSICSACALLEPVISRSFNCGVDKRKQSSYSYPTAPDLPLQRLIRSRPFNTGLDYFGPIQVTAQEQGTCKVWVSLFTCMATRALHLELVRNNTAHEFLLAFRRFIARRGTPDLLISDNASTFKLGRDVIANELLRFADDTAVTDFTTKNSLHWDFITPLSPWKGGFYERLVGVVKNALAKTVRTNVPDIRLFETLIVEIEATLNTRPLTSLSAASSVQFNTLRPIDLISPHFHIGHFTAHARESPFFVYDLSDSQAKEALRENHDMLVTALDHFWKLWREDYLQSLAQRQQKLAKNSHGSRLQPAVGDLVIVKTEDTPREPIGLSPLSHAFTFPRTAPSGPSKFVPQKTPLVDRSVNHLVPLEIHVPVETVVPKSPPLPPKIQPPRKAKRARHFRLHSRGGEADAHNFIADVQHAPPGDLPTTDVDFTQTLQWWRNNYSRALSHDQTKQVIDRVSKNAEQYAHTLESDLPPQPTPAPKPKFKSGGFGPRTPQIQTTSASAPMSSPADEPTSSRSREDGRASSSNVRGGRGPSVEAGSRRYRQGSLGRSDSGRARGPSRQPPSPPLQETPTESQPPCVDRQNGQGQTTMMGTWHLRRIHYDTKFLRHVISSSVRGEQSQGYPVRSGSSRLAAGSKSRFEMEVVEMISFWSTLK
ncbi:integrase core domain protein, partial [Ostertagia ostertagi]